MAHLHLQRRRATSPPPKPSHFYAATRHEPGGVRDGHSRFRQWAGLSEFLLQKHTITDSEFCYTSEFHSNGSRSVQSQPMLFCAAALPNDRTRWDLTSSPFRSVECVSKATLRLATSTCRFLRSSDSLSQRAPRNHGIPSGRLRGRSRLRTRTPRQHSGLVLA